MKQILITLFISFLSISVYSQDCLTTWPYIYPEFQDGTIYMSGGQKINHKMNVHVLYGRLHYIDGAIIKEALSNDIIYIEIANDRYMFVNGDIMKIVGNREKGFVATHVTADLQRLNETGGAYGTSSTSSATRKLTSVDIPGANRNHMELREGKNAGASLDLIYKYYIVTNGSVYEATKKGIESQLSPERKAEFKTFLKANKIRWKDPQSLLKLLDFLNK